MSSEFEFCITQARSPVYGGRPATLMAAGLPVDELCWGIERARTLRRTHFKAIFDRYCRLFASKA